MYVCIYLCMCVFLYVCIYMCMIYVCMQECICLWCVLTHVSIHISVIVNDDDVVQRWYLYAIYFNLVFTRSMRILVFELQVVHRRCRLTNCAMHTFSNGRSSHAGCGARWTVQLCSHYNMEGFVPRIIRKMWMERKKKKNPRLIPCWRKSKYCTRRDAKRIVKEWMIRNQNRIK